jgi:SAM-dependent methyltransferase
VVNGNWSWEQTIRWLRAQPDQAELVQSGYFDDPVEAAATRYWQSPEWQQVAARLPIANGGQALDFGAGRGIASFALARLGYKVVALEIDRSELVGADAIRSIARNTGLPIEVTESSSARLPFRDGTFDVVFGRAVLHHVDDLEEVCREFYRVLKPGGTFIAIREHVISRESDIEAFRSLHPLHKYYGGENAYTLKRYSSAIKSAGFLLQEIIRPLRSVINLFPHSIADVQTEVARRVSLGNRVLARMAGAAIRLPMLWPIVLRTIELADHRAGRLYSFMARRP